MYRKSLCLDSVDKLHQLIILSSLDLSFPFASFSYDKERTEFHYIFIRRVILSLNMCCCAKRRNNVILSWIYSSLSKYYSCAKVGRKAFMELLYKALFHSCVRHLLYRVLKVPITVSALILTIKHFLQWNTVFLFSYMDSHNPNQKERIFVALWCSK